MNNAPRCGRLASGGNRHGKEETVFSEFKAKVALAAIRGDETVADLTARPPRARVDHEASAARTAHRKQRQHQTVSNRPHLISAAELFKEWGPPLLSPITTHQAKAINRLRVRGRSKDKSTFTHGVNAFATALACARTPASGLLRQCSRSVRYVNASNRTSSSATASANRSISSSCALCLASAILPWSPSARPSG